MQPLNEESDVLLKKTFIKKNPTLSHPHIFQRNMIKPAEKIPPGSVVEVWEEGSEKFLGYAFYNGHARVGLRFLNFNFPSKAMVTSELIQAQVKEKLLKASSLRVDILQLAKVTNAMRLFNSDGDGIPGLVVDIFNNILVIEFYSAGAFRFRDLVKAFYKEHFNQIEHIYWFAEKHIQKQESFDVYDMTPPPPTTIYEYDAKFSVDVGSLHKTGFFVDQRDNRRYLQEFLQKSAQHKKVLDLCSFTGGFAVAALNAGNNKEIVAVDYDPSLAEIIEKNKSLNLQGQGRLEFVASDLFDYLTQVPDQSFDVVILDPPKQTRSADLKDQALRRYFEMNTQSLRKCRDGALFVTCSCSGLISEEEFCKVVSSAARAAQVDLSILKISGASADHPWSTRVPEGRYLKVIWGIVGQIKAE